MNIKTLLHTISVAFAIMGIFYEFKKDYSKANNCMLWAIFLVV